MKDCTTCVHEKLRSDRLPCSECYDYNKYKSKEEDVIMKDCENCLHEEVSIFDEPCIDCNNYNNWEPNVGFKIGDIIRGNSESDSHYVFTNSTAVCEVIDVLSESEVLVKIVGRVIDGEFSHDTTDSVKYVVGSDEFNFYTIEDVDVEEPKFKVGDIVIGNTMDEYGVTNSNAVCEVVSTTSESMCVKLLHTSEPTHNHLVGVEFDVEYKYFNIYDGKLDDLFINDLVNLVFVKFKNNSQKYLFLVPKGVKIGNGQTVFVNTKHGEQRATAFNNSFELDGESYDKLINAMGISKIMKSVVAIEQIKRVNF